MSNVAFTATSTRAPCLVQPWMVREFVIGLLAVAAIGISSWAVHQGAKLADLRYFGKVPAWVYKCVLVAAVALALRTFIGRPLLAAHAKKLIYLINGRDAGRRYRYPYTLDADPSWNAHESFAVKTVNGLTIKGSIINNEKSHDYYIYLLGTHRVYDSEDTERWQNIQANQVFFDPPSYGSSDGTRNPRNDFLAAEAVIQYLSRVKKVSFKNIHLRAQSIGCATGLAIAEKYQLASITLNVPQARMGSAAQTELLKLTKHEPLRTFGYWLGSTVIDDYVAYDNVKVIKNCKIKKIAMVESDRDVSACKKAGLQGHGHLLYETWKQTFAPQGPAALTEELDTPQTVSHKGYEFTYTRVLKGHEDVSFPGENYE